MEPLVHVHVLICTGHQLSKRGGGTGIEPRCSDAEGQPITQAGCVGLFENVLHAGHAGLTAWSRGVGSQHREPFAVTSLPLILGFGQLHCASLVCTPSPNYQVKAVFPM
jgi:hypothetical protein